MISNDITNFLSQANTNQIPNIDLALHRSFTKEEIDSYSSQNLSETDSEDSV